MDAFATTTCIRNGDVLVVEDNRLLALELEMALSDEGYTAFVCHSLAQAVTMIEGRRIACGLLDFELDDGDCTALAAALCEQGSPVGIVSGYAIDDLPPELRGLPVFAKPVRIGEVIDWVGRALGRQ